MVAEGRLLWQPPREDVERCHFEKFKQFLGERQLDFVGYPEMWQWSVTELERFWQAVWEFYDVQATTPYKRVLSTRTMPGCKWFEGARLNFAQHLLRTSTQPDLAETNAIIAYSEQRPPRVLTHAELALNVQKVATRLRRLGVQPGDRVAAIMPNIPEAVVAMIATLSIGAVWSAAAPEFGIRTVVDRFAQIEPKLLFTVDGYRFGGKEYWRTQANEELVKSLPSIQTVVTLPYLATKNEASQQSRTKYWNWHAFCDSELDESSFVFEQVDAMAPLWIVFSSGTTGLPKAIVHSHVGILLELYKVTGLHLDWSAEDRIFFYSSTGWVVWNILLCCLLQGSAAILYDGSPTYPSPDRLWQIAANAGATCIGASPSYIQMLEKSGVRPSEMHDLSRLRTVFLTGSPVTPDTCAWILDNVNKDTWLAIQSGGTELATAIATSLPALPVYAGEMQVRGLGVDVHAWDENGREVIDEEGELVITSPMPSMPIYFWNDSNGAKYHETYFSKRDNVWEHGDRIKINHRGGCYIYGRSDAVLNRNGVRIGAAEIYRTLEQIPEVLDSIIVCVELEDGGFYMPLFVTLSTGVAFEHQVEAKIITSLRENCGPRHVPDEIIPINAVPYTITGKKMEIPIRKMLLGVPPERAANRDAMQNPESLDWFCKFAQTFRDSRKCRSISSRVV
ncbi:acetoacetate--CoA ligase [Pseudorhodoplanes sp.]|uniref:acetoacetate--CoA ligase n=1 Tax=Pseudorhodoplanes sp. TaxID=1934341 RepID=UPI003D09E03D